MSSDIPPDPGPASGKGAAAASGKPRPVERARSIAAFLQDSILSGHYRPGDRLPSEADLCAHFAVSRPTMREALGRLAANGLIRTRRGAGGGAFVARPSMQDSARHLATLVALSGLAARPGGDGAEAGGPAPDAAWPETLLGARVQLLMACARMAAMTGADIGFIRAQIDRQSDFALDDAAFHDACHRMHLAVCEASANALLCMLGQALVEAYHSRTGRGPVEPRERARYLAFHVRLANGIAGGRPQDTDAALTDLWHFEYERLPGAAETAPQAQVERPPRMRDLRIPPVQRLGDEDGAS